MTDKDISDDSEFSRELLRQLVGKFEVVSKSEAINSSRFATSSQLFSLWQSLPGDPPQFALFKPGTIDPALLPKTVLMDVLDNGRDYRFRVYGTVHVTHFGADLTGLPLSEVEKANPAASVIRELYNMVMEQRDAIFFKLDYLSHNDVVKRATGVMMPLSDENSDIVRLFGGMDWFKT